VCEDDVVARGVSAATTGSSRACEAEFEDHVGGCGLSRIGYGIFVNAVVFEAALVASDGLFCQP